MSIRWIVAVLVGTLLVGCGPGEIEQFPSKVKSVANPDELQAWATNLIANAKSAPGESSAWLNGAKYPKWIETIYKDHPDPGIVTIEGLTNGVATPDSFVQIMYGGGFGHWGLCVGYPTLRMTNTESDQVLEWKPGIYFWNGP